MSVLRAIENMGRPEENAATFDDFWTLYPKRMAKRDAEKAWARISTADRMDALVALVKWRRVWLARGEMQYVPHPATWLNGARWEDELPVDAAPAHASHVAAVPTEQKERGEMPQEVRDLLAKLRRK